MLSPTIRATARTLGIRIRRIPGTEREVYFLHATLAPAPLDAVAAAAVDRTERYTATVEDIAAFVAAAEAAAAAPTDYRRAVTQSEIARALSPQRFGKSNAERFAERGRAHGAAFAVDAATRRAR